MDIIRFSIEKPVTIIVVVILIVLFGIIGLKKMPYQLSPSVTEPVISVTTVWPGATPYEIEREIIEEQEKVLKGLPGLTEMESDSFNNNGTITLRFSLDTKIDEALLRVSNKMNEVPSYPENVQKPVIVATGAAESPVIFNILKTTNNNPRSIYTYRTYFENEIRQYLERVPGVADLFIGGGTETEMDVIVTPEKLSAYGLTINTLINALREANVNISAGNMDVGRRSNRIRTVSQYNSPEDIKKVVISSTGQERLTVGDVADVKFGYQKLIASIFHNGKEGIAIGIKPEPGTNILQLTDNVEKVVKDINERILKPQNIYLEWVYDERPYILGAINLVKNNIYLGGFLAITILFLFLRSFSSTIVIATAIPISAIGAFIFMNALGRNLNVVSLAGISFSVGMLVDNAIVVLENIDRHRSMGKSAFEAAYTGAKEVWGAVIASTLTTIAVFLPVVFVKQEAGQLFKDISIAVTFSIALSFFVSVTVIPMLSKRLFTISGKKKSRFNFIVFIGKMLTDSIMGTVRLVTLNWFTRLATIFLLTALSIIFTVILFPKMEYLPQGNRNFVISLLIPPPGLSFKEREDIGKYILKETEPLRKENYTGPAAIKDIFYVGADVIMLCGATSIHEQRAGEMIPVLMKIINSIPGVMGVSSQAGIFQTRLGRGRTIDVDISGNDLNKLVQIGGMLFANLNKDIPGVQIRPIPSLELLYPEVKIVPKEDRLRSAGMNTDDLGITMDVLMDGRKIDDFKQEGQRKIDLVLKAAEKEISTPEELYASTIATPLRSLLPVSSIATLERTTGITEIRHLERRRAITLQVNPPMSVALQEAMEKIQNTTIPALEKQGLFKDVTVRTSGQADKLIETRLALQWNFVLALIITYLLMSALFGNFIYPFIIMFTVPLAAAGGFIGLKLVNIFIAPQPLDVLTMLGFVILIGVVVNNAILIVYQSLNNVRDYGMDYRDAVLESTRTRLRPIYMSALTSIFGLIPLVVFPGPGSELYRGLGSVMLGGLALSTFFVVFVIPAILMFFIPMEKRGNLNSE